MRKRLIAVLFVMGALLGGIAAGGQAAAAERVGRPSITLPWVGSPDATGDGVADAINTDRQPADNGELTLSQKFFRNPIVSRFIDHLDFMAFLNVLSSLRSNENLKYLPWIDLGWLVLVGIFAAWRRSRAPGILRGMWISAYTTALLVVGSIAVIPTLLLGESYCHMWLLLGHALAAAL